MTHAELLRRDAELAMREGGMYYSGEYLSRMAVVAESLDAENAKLRELVRDAHALATDHGVYVRYPYCDTWDEKLAVVEKQMRELGIEV